MIDKFAEKISKMHGLGFIKGLDHCYLICSQRLANFAGFKDPRRMMGKLDYDLCWEKHAAGYIEKDRWAFAGTDHAAVEHITDAYGKEHCIISKKTPIQNEQGEIIALTCLTEFVTEGKFLNQFSRLKNLDIKNHFFQAPHLYEFRHQIDGLTKTQFKVLSYYLRGLTTQELGILLSRSPRTIETHLAAIKERLKVQNRKELFEKAEMLGLIKYLPFEDPPYSGEDALKG